MTKNEALNKDSFLKLCRENIKREGIENLITWLENSNFFEAPASTKFHGNYDGGLCEHSLNVLNELFTLNKIYDKNFPVETMIIAGLFHDICKANFYKKELKPVKVDNVWTQKEVWVIDDKFPMGHGEKSCVILQWFIKLTVDELLAIRWHMSGFDSAVKGGDFSLSKAQAETPLVTFLSVADMLASSCEVTK